MKIFGTIDHVIGAGEVRIHRYLMNILKKPDISFVIPNLFVGGSNKIENLAEVGIDAILDLRKEKMDDQNKILNHSMIFSHIPIQDRESPSKEQITQALDWIKNNLDNGKKVFIHCNLGRGRGPLIIALYLISQGMDKEESINHVKNIRKFTFFNIKQLQLIRNF